MRDDLPSENPAGGRFRPDRAARYPVRLLPRHPAPQLRTPGNPGHPGARGAGAGWNETYTFAGGTNPDYIEQNLPDETYADLRLNLFAVTDRQGRLIYGGMYDPAAEVVLALPHSLKAHLTLDRLLRHDTTNSHIEGLLLLPEGPL